MTRPNPTKTRAKMVRNQLEQIDPRLVQRPTAHPLAEKISAGPAALSELTALVQNPEVALPDKVLALQAIGAIQARHGEDADTTSLLMELATTADHPPAIRGTAGRCLLLSNNEPFCAAFEARLASTQPEVAAAAAEAMGVARRVSAVEALIELFAKTPFMLVQSKAAWALGETGSPRALEILTAAFEAQRCLVPVIEALGKLGDLQTLACLPIALRDADLQIRFTTAVAIHHLITRHPEVDHKTLTPFLLQTLQTEPDGKVGVVLISCLQRLGATVPTALVQRVLTIDLRKGSLKSVAKQGAA